jgi:DNA-binding response OmpR family regulator
MEFRVLKLFVSNPNRVISHDDFLDQVWGYENYPCTRTVDNHILRLQQKLEAIFAVCFCLKLAYVGCAPSGIFRLHAPN